MSIHGWDENVGRQVGTLRVICTAFVSSLVIYAGLAWVLVEIAGLGGLLQIDPIIPTILAGVAVGMLPVAEIISRILRGKAISSHPDDLQASLQSYAQAVIVGFAIRESCGIVGLVLTLLTGNWLWAVALSLLALLSMLLAWPRAHSVEGWLFQHPAARRG